MLVVGLGNPGEDYAHTRHNLGADVVSLLASRHGGALRAGKNNALEDTVRLGGHLVGLAFPITYMNNSGSAVRALLRRHSITDTARLVVIHDEVDLAVGRLKIKCGGGNAGHNGLKSIEQHIHTKEFVRIRLGVGRPPGRQDTADYLLKRPSKADRIELDIVVEKAADAA
ncbi:MAG: aminoacyl-tRNA hydrolase, partial [Acidobacteria bacterium]|nr:aminoacyl-tRNA hydrolase [Acidobacteriota bacterium]